MSNPLSKMISLRRPSSLVDARSRPLVGDPRRLHSLAVGVGQTGSDVETDLADAVSREDYDNVFRRYMKKGWVPNYIAKTGWWGGKVTIKEGGHVLEVLVAPDYGAVGTNDDPFRIGNETQTLAQEYVEDRKSVV